jgi:hypothetical protein
MQTSIVSANELQLSTNAKVNKNTLLNTNEDTKIKTQNFLQKSIFAQDEDANNLKINLNLSSTYTQDDITENSLKNLMDDNKIFSIDVDSNQDGKYEQEIQYFTNYTSVYEDLDNDEIYDTLCQYDKNGDLYSKSISSNDDGNYDIIYKFDKDGNPTSVTKTLVDDNGNPYTVYENIDENGKETTDYLGTIGYNATTSIFKSLFG